MIIYQSTIKEFEDLCQVANNDLLISEIKQKMKSKLGRGVSTSEERSWRTTLPKISKFFEHLQEKDKQYILLEFKVPTTMKRIDVILVGSDRVRKSLLIIELKGWSKSSKTDNPDILNIGTKYQVGHPNYEAQEYKFLLTNQFSDINNEFENLEAVSLLPNYEVLKDDPLLSYQFEKILNAISLYTKSNINEFKKLLEQLFITGITRKDVEFLQKLEYKPTENFQKHLESEFEKIRLTSSQRLAFSKVRAEIDKHMKNPTNKKLITISGMPGSGKTVVAFKLLGYIYSNKLLSIDNKRVTAKLQLPGPEFKDAVKRTYKNSFTNMIGGAYSKSEQSVIIIDEAHKAYGQGTSKQFYSEIFRNQNFVITLIDDKQVVNKKGFTKTQVIEKAREQNFDIVELDLWEQMRNAGDPHYINWLRHWIFNDQDDDSKLQTEYVCNEYLFEVLDDTDFNLKYQTWYEKYNVRLASFWTQKWNADLEEDGSVKKLIKVGSGRYVWNPNDYWVKSYSKKNPNKKIPKWFKTNILNKNFNTQKKGYEYIAYFNTIQGSEFDYIFVHLPKLFFLNDNNELDVDLSQLDMTDMASQVWTKNKQPNPEMEEVNKTFFKNRLLVNLTRGAKGTIIYCEDKKLSNWIKHQIVYKS